MDVEGTDVAGPGTRLWHELRPRFTVLLDTAVKQARQEGQVTKRERKLISTSSRASPIACAGGNSNGQ